MFDGIEFDWLSNNSDLLLLSFGVGQVSFCQSWLGFFAVTLSSCLDFIVSVLALDPLFLVFFVISYILPYPELTRRGSNSFCSKIYKPGLAGRNQFHSYFYGFPKSIAIAWTTSPLLMRIHLVRNSISMRFEKNPKIFT